MGRKNLLQDLMGDTSAAKPADSPAPEKKSAAEQGPRYTKGAIGAVSRSIADLKSRAVIEIDPHLINAGGFRDRLEADPSEDKQLIESIREYGQQVPILVRPSPIEEGRYEVVYGRRRVLAHRDLGLPVKALVRDMDDREVVLAQGQENTARRDLSYIEKANFARQLIAAGYSRKVACDALSIDKTVISRMLAVVEQIPNEIITAIGAAPSVGRDRWGALAGLIADAQDDITTLIGTMNLTAANGSSDAAFEALYAYLSKTPRPKKPAPKLAEKLQIRDADGAPLATVRSAGARMTLQLSREASHGFGDWLQDNITEIHRRWRDGE